MSFELPHPKPTQKFCDVSVLDSGYILLTEHLAVKGGSSSNSRMVPSLSFLLHHPLSGRNIVFDLGIRKDWEEYPPGTVKIIKHVAKVEIPIDVVESLRRGGAGPDDVDTVILSHVHFDHVGNPLLFPSSRFVVGAASADVLAQGYIAGDNTPSVLESQFARDLLPASRTSYLASDDWKPVGPFPRSYDFFGDGSMYLIDAAGHLPGHLNVLVRTSSDGAWLLLAGDSAHDVRLITGEKEIGSFLHPITGSMMCLHRDIEGAKKHIERIRQVCTNPRVQVLLAHDWVWYEEHKDKGVAFPGKIRPS